jgi:hypothetical protein
MSTQIDDGGPAFPCPVEFDPNGQLVSHGSFGMTLRDWFAGQAIGHIANYAMVDGWARSGPEWRDAVASESYKFADAMLAARKEKP